MKTSKLYRMYILSFFFSLHIALSAYVNSTFLSQFIPEKYTGLLFATASILTLVLLAKNTVILNYFGNRRLVLVLLFVNMLSIVGLITSSNPTIIGASFIGLSTTNTLIYMCLDIFIEHFGNKQTIGRTRGLYLTILNAAWLISPLITSMLITEEGGYRSIYIVSFIATVIMTMGLLFSVKTFKDAVYRKAPFIETYKYLRKNAHMLSIFKIAFILQFFYSTMVIYTPLYLNKHMGLGWDKIGLIFTVMLVPFIIFGLLVGILIDVFHVRKRTLLYIGFSIMAVSTLLIPTIATPNIIFWALVLFFTRVGASIIEATSEIYFFTHVKEEDSHLLGFFRDMSPVAYIVAPIASTIVFIILPFKYIFVFVGLIVLSGIYFVPKLKHHHDGKPLPAANQ